MMGETVFSRISLNRNKSTMQRRKVANSFKSVGKNLLNMNDDNSYACEEIPELSKNRKVSSVLKNYKNKFS